MIIFTYKLFGLFLSSLLDDVVQSNKEIRFLERFLTRKHATRGFFELLGNSCFIFLTQKQVAYM